MTALGLAASGKAWKRAKAAERDKMADLYEAIRVFVADGGTEVQAANVAGVDRMTVRRALGKL